MTMDELKAIPIEMKMHINATKEHILVHGNDEHGITMQTVTKYRSGKPGTSTRTFHLKGDSRIFTTAQELLDAINDKAKKVDSSDVKGV